MAVIYSRILVAYDGSELAEKALETAKNFAEQDPNVSIDVVTVQEPFKLYGYHIELSYEQIQKQYEQDLKEMMNEVREKLADLPNQTQMVELKGYPAREIIEYAEKNDIDLIVMGSRGLGNIKELFLGSVSHNVVQHSPKPVLIVK
ncbi:MAG: universal stress protein [Bacillaceae bacterium]|nr:universal stress protein [Bacillaceae bacterium]